MAFLGFPSRGDWYRDGNIPIIYANAEAGSEVPGFTSMPCDAYVKQKGGLQAESMLRSRLLR